MGLFDKKYCDICGEKIGLLGNRKLENGNMCKNCGKKLSPFFSERRSSTVDEIKQQLSYREQNKQILATFSPMFTFGEDNKIYIDPMKQSFVVSRRNPGSWSDENPDVIPLSSILNCASRIEEDREELYTQGKDGQNVSYNPPRYKFTYDFYVDIKVNNPYFDEISVRLNNTDVEGLGTMEYHRYQQMAQQVINNLSQNGNMGMQMNGGFNQPMNNGFNQQMNGGFNQQMNGGFNQPMNNGFNQPMNNGFNQQMNGGYAQQNTYNQFNQNNGYNPAPSQQPMTESWVCPSCNANNDSGKFCQFCGAPKQ